MKKIIFFFHGGSKNHGCEAIVRSSNKMLHPLAACKLFTFSISEDADFKLDKVCPIVQLGPEDKHTRGPIKSLIKKFLPLFIIRRIQAMLPRKRRTVNCKVKYNIICQEKPQLALSIGGDNYCYDDFSELAASNAFLQQESIKTILWGCSIEPKDIKNDKTLREDLNRYSLITARESLTYNALIQNGINKNTHLFPDPAFVMDKVLPTDLPSNFLPGNTVGLNLSPLVQRLEQGGNIAFKNFETLMRYILQNTQMNIALIPHVIWENNNDLEPLTKLYRQFKHTGRVCLIDKPYNAMELKGIISQCRFMVAARTHASIAAYSTQVPTLVIGYSVKARGIARDIFGTEEGYVLPVQGLKEQDEVTRAFVNLMANEAKIRAHYKEFMPGYIAKAYQAAEEVKKLL